VLPDDDRVLVEVRDVSASDPLGILLHDHPTEVGVEQSLADGVGVLVGVGVSVVSTMVSRPPADGSLNRSRSDGREEDAERERGRVRGMSPKSVVTWKMSASIRGTWTHKRGSSHIPAVIPRPVRK
jgi:hypothetical protein